ncbi:hypothetical protein CBL13_04059 [Pseudomonas putida]|nr:hypothetical protein CBL13_04059 [Pseudomonas putida]
MKQRPLRRHTCEGCSRTFYSRSPLSRFCNSTCQSRTWKQNNKVSQAELEQLFIAQEQAKQQEQEAA